MRKALPLIVQSVYFSLLEMSLDDCYVVRKILENLTGRDKFSNLLII